MMPQPFDPKLIDQLLEGHTTPEAITGENGLLKQLTKALLERALHAEMTHHLGHEPNARVTNTSKNARNGTSKKTMQGEFGKLQLEIPRDRIGSFEPILIPKHERRLAGFDDKILALYARGMSTRDIQEALKELYGVDVDSSLISIVTDSVLEEVKTFLTIKCTLRAWSLAISSLGSRLLGSDFGLYFRENQREQHRDEQSRVRGYRH
jgi:putative transposase